MDSAEYEKELAWRDRRIAELEQALLQRDRRIAELDELVPFSQGRRLDTTAAGRSDGLPRGFSPQERIARFCGSVQGVSNPKAKLFGSSAKTSATSFDLLGSPYRSGINDRGSSMYFIANDLGNRRTFWANGIFYASVRRHPSTIAELLAEPKSGKAPKPLCSLD
jgi:hypothetical protein